MKGKEKNKKLDLPILSLNARVESLARFLRQEVQKQEIQKKKTPSHMVCIKQTGPINTIQQIARLLREETHKLQKNHVA